MDNSNNCGKLEMKEQEKKYDDFFDIRAKIARLIKNNMKYKYITNRPLDIEKAADDIFRLLTKSGLIRTKRSITKSDLIRN